MKTPTIEEVKEYFKDAKEVRCDSYVYKGIYEIIENTIRYDKGTKSYFCDTTNKISDVLLWDFETKQYTEIISYKTKTYTVDETFIKEAYQSACDTWKAKIKDKFPDAFKTELEVGKWYKYKDSGVHLVCFTSVQESEGYGFDLSGWQKLTIWSQHNLRLATDEEVKTALVKEAEKRGFKNGVKYKNVNTEEQETQTIKDFKHIFCSTSFLTDGWGGAIFKDGIWAEIIKETEVSLTDLIECYKKTNNIDNLKVI